MERPLLGVSRLISGGNQSAREPSDLGPRIHWIYTRIFLTQTLPQLRPAPASQQKNSPTLSSPLPRTRGVLGRATSSGETH